MKYSIGLSKMLKQNGGELCKVEKWIIVKLVWKLGKFENIYNIKNDYLGHHFLIYDTKYLND